MLCPGCWWMGVSMAPGLTALTRMRRSSSSAESVRVRERTAAFEADSSARPGAPTWFSHEVLRMIEPPGCMIGSTACREKNRPLTFMSIRPSYCSSVVVDSGVA
ncbi:hypothetical protein D3C84_975640 [compost metagenome]